MGGENVTLSARMEALAKLVTPGICLCDVGCDHGFVSIALVQRGICPKVFAMDVRPGPLERAREHIREHGLEEYIETRLSDGLSALRTGEAQGMLCAGMGGRLMMRILREGGEKLQAMEELILQPQSELREFRIFLRERGYVTVAENMVYEDGKYYPMMKAVPGGKGKRAGEKARGMTGGASGSGPVCASQGACRGPWEIAGSAGRELEDRFGRLLLEQRHPVLEQYLRHTLKERLILIEGLRAQGGEGAAARAEELEREAGCLGRALEMFRQAGRASDRGASGPERRQG